MINPKAKATYENLYNIGFLKEKPLDLMEFGDQAGFFKREGDQRVQDYSCELSPDELKEQYSEYLENPPINIGKLWYVDDGFRVLLYSPTLEWIYLYDIDNQMIHRRVVKKIKKYDNDMMFKHQNKFISVKEIIGGDTESE